MIVLWVMILSTGCGRNEEQQLYHRFPGNEWDRFNILSYKMPIKQKGMYDVWFFTGFQPAFEYDTLNFNMVMNTPGGEERINEYKMAVKTRKGTFCIPCSKDSCSGSVLLKREISFGKPGVLKIEIENLTPRLRTENVLGAGIRVVRK